MSGEDKYRCECDGPINLLAPLLYLSLQHGRLEERTCLKCNSHLKHSFIAWASIYSHLDECIRRACREELSVKEGIENRLKQICWEEISKLQVNIIGQACIPGIVKNSEEYCNQELWKKWKHWIGEESIKKTYIETIANVVGVRKR